MSLKKYSETYSSFFSQYSSSTNISVNDTPLEMNEVQAVGHVDDLEKLLEKCSAMTIIELCFESERYFNNSFVGEAFFYYAMAGLQNGREMNEISREFMSISKIAENPYTMHHLHLSFVQDHSNPIFVFLDWDGTIEV